MPSIFVVILIKAFFFDLDGTIWNSENIIIDTIYSTILEERGENITKKILLEELKEYHSPLRVLSAHGAYTHNSYWGKYRHNSERIELFFNNTQEVFKDIQKHKKFIGYVTSLKKEVTIKLLDKFGLRKYASIIITPSECRVPKPNPKSILMALEKLSVKSDNAIYIGNQDIDIIAAKRAGCKAGLASWGVSGEISEEPDYVFERIGDVLSLVTEVDAK